MNESSSEKSFSSDEFADEGDWYASLVAGERVGEWLDVIESAVEEKEEEDFLDASLSSESLKKAISNLTLKVREDETYGEEAEVAEAERRVREALEKVRARKCEKKEEKDPQEDVSILLEKSVDALETYRKKKKSAKTYAIKDGRVEVSILETKLSNGVGGKLWKAALLLAEQLDDEREEGEGAGREASAEHHAAAGLRGMEGVRRHHATAFRQCLCPHARLRRLHPDGGFPRTDQADLGAQRHARRDARHAGRAQACEWQVSCWAYL